MPLISVIIPSGRPDRVPRTVAALHNQTFHRSQYEIIVVTPMPGNMLGLENSGVRIVGVERLYPPGRMRNVGAAAALGEILFFIDDDCAAPTDWLAVLTATLKDDETIGAVGCRVVSADSGFWSRCADYALFSPYQYHQRLRCDLGSAAIAVRRDAFEAVNGFDESLLASEDWDFSLRLKEKGWVCVFDPSVEVKHDHLRNTFAGIITQAHRSGHLSGLIVQKRHIKSLSWLARLSVRMANPGLYWILLLPYAVAVTSLQTLSSIRYDWKVGLYFPFILMARICYHIGVWQRLASDRRCL